MAAHRGNIKVLKLLLAWGADITARDSVRSIAALFAQQLLLLLSPNDLNCSYFVSVDILSSSDLMASYVMCVCMYVVRQHCDRLIGRQSRCYRSHSTSASVV